MIMSLSMANCSQDYEVDYSEEPDCIGHPEQLPSLANLSGLVAMNCTLGLCVRDYTSRVRNGELEETMTSSLAPNLLPEEKSTEMYKTLKLPCTVDSNNYDISNISQILRTPERTFTTVIFNGQNVTAPLECVFATEVDLLMAISHFLQDGLLQPKDGGQALKTSRGKRATCSTNSLDGSSFCDPWYLEPLFRGGSPYGGKHLVRHGQRRRRDFQPDAGRGLERTQGRAGRCVGDGDPDGGLREGGLTLAAVSGRTGAAHRGLVRRGARRGEALPGC